MSILDKRLLVMSGKGGVGKTTVACALAVAAARKGKKVAMVEIGARENIPAMFGKNKEAGYKGMKVWSPRKNKKRKKKAGSVTSIRLDPQSALREFVVKQVKVEAIYRAIFQNRVMRYFTAAAPGLEDLLMLGKIVYLAEETGRGSDYKWDLVIMDAPATGHAKAFFNSAYAFLQISGVGPMRRRVEHVWDFLQDPEKTAFNVVSLAEEMPVNETLELWRSLGDEWELPRGIAVANGVFPPLVEGSEEESSLEAMESAEPSGAGPEAKVSRALLQAARSRQKREQMQRGYVDELADGIDAPLFELPYLFAPDFGVKQVQRLAKELKGA